MSEEYFEEEDFQAKVDSKILKRIFGFIEPHWRWVAGFLIAIALVSTIDAVFTYLGKQIIDQGIVARDKDALVNLLTIYGILMVVQAASVFTFIYLTSVLGERVRYDLRKKMFDHLQDLSLSYYSRTKVGWIMSRVTSDSERVAELLTWGIVDSSWGAMNIVTSLIFMSIINWKLTLIVVILLPILYFVASKFQKKIIGEFRNVRKINSKITGAYNENITGVRVVKALVREDENMREFGALTHKMYHASYRAAWLSALFLPSVQIVSACAVAAVVWYGGIQAINGALTIGGIQAFVSYITFMMWPIQDLARVFAEMQHAIASAERIFSLIDAEPDVKDQENAFQTESIKGDIEFDHVYFSYEDDNPVLEDFTLKVKRGETIALVGPTGGGKSTIVNLLCRFYEPVQGEIRIGGENYKNFTMRSLQSRIGIVLQTPHLFSGTILENIQYGKLDATREQIETAAKLVDAHSFISQFEKGYDEEVGEGGNLLSVGQKQLISLTRAVLADPEIFIMDEATSSVDTLTEVLIQHGMNTLMTDRTSFVIAHRLSTIKRADRIVLIEDGKIAEMGTHRELLKLRGKYYHLYTQQFRNQLEKNYDLFEQPVTDSAG